MEGPSPWTSAALAMARTTLGASFFPVGAALAYAAAHTYGATMAVLFPGGILFGIAFLATLVLLVAAGRSAGEDRARVAGYLGGAVLSLFAQLFLAVAIAGAWGAAARSSRPRPGRRRHTHNRPNRSSSAFVGNAIVFRKNRTPITKDLR